MGNVIFSTATIWATPWMVMESYPSVKEQLVLNEETHS